MVIINKLDFVRHPSSDDQFLNFDKSNQEDDAHNGHDPRFPTDVSELQPSGDARSVDTENHKGKGNDECANHPSVACDARLEHRLMHTSCVERVD